MLLIQFKSNKMLVRLSIIFLAISTMVKAEVTELLDLPLKMPDGELVIDAYLFGFSEQFEYFAVKETVLASESAITGKIQVSNDKDSHDIHYQFDRSGKDSKERLVIHGNDCTLYTHSKMTQNANLFGTNNPLRDLILLMGPSIMYRLDGQSTVWREFREINTKAVTVNKTLLITVSSEDRYDTSYGVKNSLKIDFNEPTVKPPGINSLTLHIHFAEFRPLRLKYSEYRIQPSPGIGCPNYLIKSERKSIPKLFTIRCVHTLVFSMWEEIEGATRNRVISSDIMASGKRILMWLKTNPTTPQTKVIYDNELGIILTREKGGHCQMKIGDRKSPECDVKGYFKLENFFFVDGDFNYIEKTNLGGRLYSVDAWESVHFNVDFEGNKVDKFVVTQYFVESPDNTIFNGSSLKRTIISIYNSSLSDSSQKSYVLAKRITKNYVHMRADETEHELYDHFKFNDCEYLLSDRKVTLNFKIGCEVLEVILTEMNLNPDQCASLCHGWTDGDTRCKSFSYCPRNINAMESSCSLTKFSVKSSDANSTEGGYCFNYEFITRSNDKTNEESSEIKLIKGTSESNAFGIIMMFLVIVSLLVFSAPCVYEKIKPKRVFAQLNESLTWTKQVDEQPGTTKINMSDF